MVYWCEKNIENKQNSIIDLGCGNGHLCLELCSLGFTNLIGVDYSQSAVSLALQIAKDKGGDCTTNIHYQTMDILDSHQCTSLLLKNHGGIDFALDKGTYDAISLATAKDYKVESDITPTTACSPADIYVQMVHSLLSPTQGTLLITSCNWTEEELKSRFSKCKFVVVSPC